MERPILLDFPEQMAGERIVVRPWRDDDAQAMFDAIRESAEYIAAWLPWPDRHRSVDDTLSFIRHTQADLARRESFGLGIFDCQTGEVLGGIGLHPRNWDVPSFEIGYWIRQPREGKGYVTEAAKLLIRFAFGRFGANRVFIRCDTRNARSRAIPERLGFVTEGTFRNELRNTAGELADMVFYAMTPKEFTRAEKDWT
jgi:RimJ/RimL family protein N-acetyltransferase